MNESPHIAISYLSLPPSLLPVPTPPSLPPFFPSQTLPASRCMGSTTSVGGNTAQSTCGATAQRSLTTSVCRPSLTTRLARSPTSPTGLSPVSLCVTADILCSRRSLTFHHNTGPGLFACVVFLSVLMSSRLNSTSIAGTMGWLVNYVGL